MKLVTLAQANLHLRRDSGDDDSDVLLKIEAASASVLEYLGAFADSFLDSAGEVLVDSAGDPLGIPSRVQSATLLTVGWLYRERDGSQEFAVPTQWGYGYGLPQGATALLYSLRKPTVA